MLLISLSFVTLILISYSFHEIYLTHLSRSRTNQNIELVIPNKWPQLTCIIPAANEESTIQSKINNLKEAYPEDCMKIIVVLNNSSDSTKSICEKLNVTFIESPAGKQNALEAGRHAAKTDYILVTDCDVILNTDTIKRLVSNLLQQPDSVCAVSAFCGYRFSKQSQIGVKMNAHEMKQAETCQLQGEIASSALIQGPCYVYKKDIFPVYNSIAVEDELSMAIEVARAGYRAATDVKAESRQFSPSSFWQILLMLTRHAGRQIHTSLHNLDIIFTSKIKMYGLFVFPFYILIPRLLPFITIFLLALPWLTPINMILFYLTGIAIFIVIVFINPFFALQIIALHSGWIYAAIYCKSGSVWNNKNRRVYKA